MKDAEQRAYWQRLNEIFEAAVELPTGERSAFLEDRCGADPYLRSNIERLLAAARRANESDFLGSDAFALGAKVLSDEMPKRELTGRMIGPYRIVSEIAVGGMGAVFLAERDDFLRRVALKLIRAGKDSEDIHRRFLLERDVLASLDHPNIARLLDGGTTDEGLPYLVMEHVEGVTIDKFCASRKLDIPEVLALFQKVCAAVAYAHQNLTVHRDIKPSNIIVTADGVPKLLDFGISKILGPPGAVVDETATANRLLTPEYASPEQLTGGRISTASDVYSLGVLLHELLTGRRPFELKDKSPLELIDAICNIEPAAPSTKGATGDSHRGERPFAAARLYGDLDNIILTALRKDPDRRYSSAEHLSDDIERYLSGLPVMARPATVAYRAAKFIKRNKVSASFAALAAIALMAGSAVAIWNAVEARRERDRAERRFGEVRQLAKTLVEGWDEGLQDEDVAPEVRGRLADISSEYLNKLAFETDEPELLRDAAAAKIKLGHDYAYFMIDQAKAKQSFIDAEQLSRRVLSKHPADAAARSLLVMSLAKYDEFFGPEDLERFAESKKEQIELRETIIAARPGDLAELRDLALALEHCGDVFRELGRSDEALGYFEKAEQRYSELVSATRSSPGSDLKPLASAFAARGLNLTKNLGRSREGVENGKQGLEAARAANSAAPDDRSTAVTFLTASYELGNIAFAAGELVTAAVAFTETAAFAEGHKDGLTDPFFVRKRYDSLMDLGEIAFANGDGPKALRDINEAFRIRREFTALPQNAGSIRQWSSHAWLFERGAKLLGRMRRQNEADAAFEEAEAMMKRLLSVRNPIASSYANFAGLQFSRGEEKAGLAGCRFDGIRPDRDDAACTAASLDGDRKRLSAASNFYRKTIEAVDRIPEGVAKPHGLIAIRESAVKRLALVSASL